MCQLEPPSGSSDIWCVHVSDVDRLVVITGGPGSRKSTFVEALAAHGLSHMPEAGRAIIQDQLAIGGNALP
jgi:predicted ATPase